MQIDVHVQWNLDQDTDLAPFSLSATVAPLQLTGSICDYPWQQWFQTWLTCLHPPISPIQSYALSLVLTDNVGIQTLNASYRNQDRATDVLAFATLDQESLPTPLWSEMPVELGDIIISVETAMGQAQEQQHSLVIELAWLATHGLLHLLGWDHPDPAQLNVMLTQQQKLLESVNLLPTSGQD